MRCTRLAVDSAKVDRRDAEHGYSAGQDLASGVEHLGGPAVVDVGRAEQRDPAVAVTGVVPGEEVTAERPGGHRASRSGRESPAGT